MGRRELWKVVSGLMLGEVLTLGRVVETRGGRPSEKKKERRREKPITVKTNTVVAPNSKHLPRRQQFTVHTPRLVEKNHLR